MQPVLLQERAATSIRLGESHFREFKSAIEGPPGKKSPRPAKAIATDISESLVAFANADGGELLVGVEDNGQVTGIAMFTEEQIQAFETAPERRVHADTPLRSVRKARVQVDGMMVLYFAIPKSIEFVHLTSNGRCLQRRDLETIPMASEQILFSRREVASREYDRSFVDGPRADALDIKLIRVVADQISKGMSAEKCLQYLELAEYVNNGLRLRRAALLLFANEPQKWHPRLQVRIIKVDGTEIGSGEKYNVISDQTIFGNIITLMENGWDALRPHLVQTRLGDTARFEKTVMYPEHACREALVNAIAHRDYSEEGRGIEIYVFSDRMEVQNPGALLSTISVEDLMRLDGVHQSRNSFVARVLRELGYMRELGEGMRRIFSLMETSELIPPEIKVAANSFTIVLHHKAAYSQEELLWLDQFASKNLNREQRSVVVLGRNEKLIAPQDIWDTLGIVDTEEYRRLVSSLQDKRILITEIPKPRAQALARRRRVGVRQIPRFKVVPLSALNSGKAPSATRSKKAAAIEDFGSLENRLFVANLPMESTSEDLADFFAQIGDVEEIFVPMAGNKSKGYAFVEFSSGNDIAEIISKIEQVEYRNRKLVVQKARPRT